MHNLAVFDHVYTGPLYTWTNKQDEGFMARKLDQALVNCSWLYMFASSRVYFLSPCVSDHSVAFIKLSQESLSPPKPFKFFSCWTKHAEFMATVKTSWQIPMEGSPMEVFT